MITKTTALEVLNVALSTGADFAEIYLEEDDQTSIRMDNGKVESCNDTLTRGAGIRLLKDLRSVYGYTNNISRTGLLKLAEDLSGSFDGERIVTVESISKVRQGSKHRPRIKYSDYPREDLRLQLQDR